MLGDLKIPYHKPIVKEGKISVLLPKIVCENASTLWEDSPVGQFVGYATGYNHIFSTTNSLWGRQGKVEVTSMGNKAFLFKFPDMYTKNWVLKAGPLYIGQRPIFLRIIRKE